ncbi:MAG TPA: SDR family oxidoreductase [Noviherbaspirillum sp.]|nr:SDR family oxidoreductase [Noviherbaspirillum sp.]
MPTALILGASRGIGRELVRQLRAAGWKVYATARDDAALAALNQEGAVAYRVDVTRPDSLAGLGWQLDGEALDLAIYVAGVFGSREGATSPPTAADFDRVMHTNVLGAMQVIPTIAPMVEAARGRFAFISSGMGSIDQTTQSYGWVYRASKAALNMVVKSAAQDYPNAIFLALSPGWVKTDMGGESAPTEAGESVRGMLQVLETATPADSGGFRHFSGRELPW